MVLLGHKSKNVLFVFLFLFSLIAVWYLHSRITKLNHAVVLKRIDVSDTELRSLDSIRVGAYNIAHGRGQELGASNWTGASKEGIKSHLLEIADLINGLDLDIVVLNEIDFSVLWSRHINQAEFIAEKAHYPYLVEQRNMDVAFPFIQFRFGNAILSRYPVKDFRFIQFPPLSKKEDFFVGNHDGVMCEVQLPNQRIRVLAVHLEYRDEAVRVECAKMIAELEQQSDLPLIALGDFNSTLPAYPKANFSDSGVNAMQYLQQTNSFHFYQFGKNPRFTFPAEKPDRVIDWVLCSKSLRMEEGDVVASELSDHLPVVAKIQLSDNTFSKRY